VPVLAQATCAHIATIAKAISDVMKEIGVSPRRAPVLTAVIAHDCDVPHWRRQPLLGKTVDDFQQKRSQSSMLDVWPSFMSLARIPAGGPA
jgi:hypothetical protein